MIKNIYLMSGSILSRLLTNIVIFFLIGNLWGVKPFGEFMYYYTITSLLVLILDYGYSINLVKDVSAMPEKYLKIVTNMMCSKILLTVPMILLSIIVFYGVNINKNDSLVFWILLTAAVFNSFAQFFCLPFRALNKFKVETVISILSNTLLFLTIFILYILKANPLQVAIGFVIARLLYLIIAFLKFFPTLNYSITVRCHSLFTTLRDTFPYALQLIIGSIFIYADTLIISYFMGNEGVGIYQSVFRFFLGGLMLVEILTNVYLPKLSNVYRNKRLFSNESQSMNRHLTLIGSIVSLSVIAMSSFIVNITYGKEFNEAIDILDLFGILLFIRFVSTSYGTILTISNKQYLRVICSIFLLMLNIILNIFLIQHFSIEGIIYAAIICGILLLIIFIYFSISEIEIKLINNKVLNMFVVTLLLMFLVVLFNIPFEFKLIIISVNIILNLIWGLTPKEKERIKILVSQRKNGV
jgi:O-antigen/teichoic acid export membrane protein